MSTADIAFLLEHGADLLDAAANGKLNVLVGDGGSLLEPEDGELRIDVADFDEFLDEMREQAKEVRWSNETTRQLHSGG